MDNGGTHAEYTDVIDGHLPHNTGRCSRGEDGRRRRRGEEGMRRGGGEERWRGGEEMK